MCIIIHTEVLSKSHEKDISFTSKTYLEIDQKIPYRKTIKHSSIMF